MTTYFFLIPTYTETVGIFIKQICGDFILNRYAHRNVFEKFFPERIFDQRLATVITLSSFVMGFTTMGSSPL